MAKLVINPTSASKKEIPIASRVISIGRDPSNDLVLSDSMVSRRHAILEQRDEIFVLRDNNSSNGTMVNGDKVDAEKTLRDGDLLAIGSSRLLFQLDDGVASGSHPSVSPMSPAPMQSASLDELADVSTEGDLGPSRFSPFTPPAAAGSISCPSCGNEALASDRFCRSCGSELHEKTSVNCTACGTVVPLPAEFCGNCGHELPKKLRASLPTRHLSREDLLAEAPLGDDGAGSPPASVAPAPVAPASRVAGASPGPGRPRPRPAKASRDEEEAGLGIRAIAGIVDSMILGIPFLLISLVSSMFSFGGGAGSGTGGLLLVSILFPVVGLVYFIFFWGFHGATPGKSLLGLSVQTETGESPIGVQAAGLRVLGYFASTLVLGVGFLLIAFSEDKRGLHDRIAGTRVMRHL